MPFYVYLSLCDYRSFYSRYTKNIDERTKLHTKSRGARYTMIHKHKRVACLELLDSQAKAKKYKASIDCPMTIGIFA